MSHPTRVTGLSLAAANPEALLRFYREALGVAIVEYDTVQPSTERSPFIIRRHTLQDDARGWRVLMEADSVEDAELRILASGGSLENVTHIFNGQRLQGRDPEGNAFVLLVRMV